MKMTSSNIVNIALSVVLLTALLYVGVTNSQLHPYDPWWDLNDDGVIDIQDLARVSGAFGTFGDSTKDVSVTNWPPYMNVSVISQVYTPTNLTIVDRIVLYSTSVPSKVLLASPYNRFTFDFDPQREANVTAVWLQILQTTGDINQVLRNCFYDIWINGQLSSISTDNIAWSDSWLCVTRLNITDLNQSIVQGLNSLDLAGYGYHNLEVYAVAAFEIVLFVEYRT